MTQIPIKPTFNNFNKAPQLCSLITRQWMGKPILIHFSTPYTSITQKPFT